MHGVYLQRAHGLYLSTSIVGVVAQENPGKQLWSTPRVRLAGLPERAPWPSPQQLISLLRTAPAERSPPRWDQSFVVHLWNCMPTSGLSRLALPR